VKNTPSELSRSAAGFSARGYSLISRKKRKKRNRKEKGERKRKTYNKEKDDREKG